MYLTADREHTFLHIMHLPFRSFVTWEQRIPVNPLIDHSLRQDLDDYKQKLLVPSGPIPDPFTLNEWRDETYKYQWPPLSILDMADYLRSSLPYELSERICNEYKVGKGYRYVYNKITVFVPLIKLHHKEQ